MNLIELIDQEIARLQAAKALLSETTAGISVGRRPGRPSSVVAVPAKAKLRKKRSLSPEARARIAAAQKKRWAAAKKTR